MVLPAFPTPFTTDKIRLNTGRKIVFVSADTIQYIEACNYYILIHTREQIYIVRETLKEFGQRLPVDRFIHVHRSFILHVSMLISIEKNQNQTIIKTSIGKDFPVSRYRKRALLESLMS